MFHSSAEECYLRKDNITVCGKVRDLDKAQNHGTPYCTVSGRRHTSFLQYLEQPCLQRNMETDLSIMKLVIKVKVL